MVYRILADAVILTHFLFILFVIFGGFLVIKRRFVIWFHLPAVFWGGFIELSGGICPLTPLENLLRAEAGLTRYSGDFIERYIFRLVYPKGLTHQQQIILGILVLAINGIVYGFIIKTRRQNRENK